MQKSSKMYSSLYWSAQPQVETHRKHVIHVCRRIAFFLYASGWIKAFLVTEWRHKMGLLIFFTSGQSETMSPCSRYAKKHVWPWGQVARGYGHRGLDFRFLVENGPLSKSQDGPLPGLYWRISRLSSAFLHPVASLISGLPDASVFWKWLKKYLSDSVVSETLHMAQNIPNIFWENTCVSFAQFNHHYSLNSFKFIVFFLWAFWWLKLKLYKSVSKQDRKI